MPVPTPGREGEAPSLVLQELSTQPDLSATAGIPPHAELRGLRQAFRALRHRNFRLFAAGALAHAYGARLTVLACGVLAMAAAAIFSMKRDVFREVR